MPSISAVDAISPAIHRTRTFLFNPFRWHTYLKLCLVAIITEGFGANVHFSCPGSRPSHHRHALRAPIHLAPGWIAVIIAASLLFILLSFFLYYLITRLRFAYFHCLIHNTKEIRPGWRLYRTQANRFFWLNVVVGLCFLLLLALIAAPFVAGFWRLFHNIPPGGHPDLGPLLALILPIIPIILLVILAGIAADLTLRDFMLPHYALENATAGQAWAAAWAHIKAEKSPFFVYALLRVVLPIVAMIAVFIAVIIPTLIIIVAIAFLALLIHAALAGATGGAAMAGVFLLIVAGVVTFGIALLLWISLGGPVSTAIREYALIFYGGRYQRLGEILFPPPDVSLNQSATV